VEEVLDAGVDAVVEQLDGFDDDEQTKEERRTDLHFEYLVDEREDLREGDLRCP